MLLISGKQKELIEFVKSRYKLSWKTLAKKLGLNESYLRNEIRNEKRTLSEENFNKLNKLSTEAYGGFIERYLPDRWGQVKGGKSVKIHPCKKPSLLCEKSKFLAEIIGVILGDGSIYSNRKYGVYQMRIAGHSELDRSYLVEYIKPLFKKTVKIDLYTKASKISKEIFVWKQSKDLVYTLIEYGLKSGNKVKDNIRIPGWIFEKRSYTKACLRGIIDTDGCVYPKTTKHPYPSIWIKSAVPNLRDDISKAFKLLNYHPSKWTKNGTPQCCLGKSTEVKRFYKEVGFKNPKHLNRWRKYAPVV